MTMIVCVWRCQFAYGHARLRIDMSVCVWTCQFAYGNVSLGMEMSVWVWRCQVVIDLDGHACLSMGFPVCVWTCRVHAHGKYWNCMNTLDLRNEFCGYLYQSVVMYIRTHAIDWNTTVAIRYHILLENTKFIYDAKCTTWPHLRMKYWCENPRCMILEFAYCCSYISRILALIIYRRTYIILNIVQIIGGK
jgi:hypothetical protein